MATLRVYVFPEVYFHTWLTMQKKQIMKVFGDIKCGTLSMQVMYFLVISEQYPLYEVLKLHTPY